MDTRTTASRPLYHPENEGTKAPTRSQPRGFFQWATASVPRAGSFHTVSSLPGSISLVAAFVLLAGSFAPAAWAQTDTGAEDSEAVTSESTTDPTLVAGIDGLPDLDLEDAAALRAARQTLALRVNLIAYFGEYRLRDTLVGVFVAVADAEAKEDTGALIDLNLLKGLVELKLREYVPARAAFDQALELSKKNKDALGGTLAKGYTALLEIALNRPAKATALLEEVLTELKASDEKALEAYFETCLADIALRQDKLDDAVARYEHALETARAAGSTLVEGLVLRHLGDAYLCRNEPPQAAAKIEAAIVVHRSAKQPISEAMAHRFRGVVHLLKGDFNNARMESQRARKLEPEFSGVFPPQNSSEDYYWRFYQWRGDYEKVLDLLARAIRIAESKGDDKLLEAHLHRYKAGIWYTTGQFRNAFDEYSKARSLYHEVSDIWGEAAIVPTLLRLQYSMGELEAMKTTGLEALDNDSLNEVPDFRTNVLRTMARLALNLGETTGPVALLEQALEVAREQGDRVLEGDILDEIGGVLEKNDKTAEAIKRYEEALAIFEDLEDIQWEIRLWGKLETLYKDNDRSKDAKKMAKKAKPYEEWTWTPFFRPPTMPMASNVEMLRWMMTVSRFGDLGSLGRARVYRFQPDVDVEYKSMNEFVKDVEETVANLKASENLHGVVEPMDTMIRVLVRMDQVDKALKTREEQLALVRQMGHYLMEKTYLGHAAEEYAEQEKYDRALELLGQGLVSARETGNKSYEAEFSVDKGEVLIKTEKFQEAAEAGEHALEIGTLFNDAEQKFSALGVMTAAYRGAKDQEKASKFHDEAMALVPELDIPDDATPKLGELAESYRLLGEYDAAIETLEKLADALPKKAKDAKEDVKDEIKKIKEEKESHAG